MPCLRYWYHCAVVRHYSEWFIADLPHTEKVTDRNSACAGAMSEPADIASVPLQVLSQCFGCGRNLHELFRMDLVYSFLTRKSG